MRRGNPHRRRPKTIDIPADKIRVPENLRSDPLYFSKFRLVATGKAAVAFSRLPEDWIEAGFYIWEAGAAQYVCDPVVDILVSMVAGSIRDGRRPEIEVYWSPLSPREKKYVCPDDVTTLIAYRMTGIREVPVRIYGARSETLKHSAVSIYPAGKNKGYGGIIACTSEGFSSLLGADVGEAGPAISLLIEACASVDAAVAGFDRGGGDVSYHDAVRAQLQRSRRTLESIGLLIAQDRIDHSLALVRLLYEGYLNHFLDWLAPEFFGPRLQTIAQFKRLRARDMCQGLAHSDSEVRKALGGLLNLADSVEQKARLSPLGDIFYRLAYPPLSFVVHQDYGEMVGSLNDPVIVEDAAERLHAVLRWSDVITAALIDLVQADTGPPPAQG